MVDTLTPEARSRNMGRIKGANTKPELLVRKYLHAAGYRYRLNVDYLPGKPDIVLRRFNTVVLVHGCFWHRHENCQYCYTPKSRTAFWEKKFQRTIQRDIEVKTLLSKSGWRILTIWECALKPKYLQGTMNEAISWIKNTEDQGRSISAPI